MPAKFLEPLVKCPVNERYEESGLCSQCTLNRRPVYCECLQEKLTNYTVCSNFYISCGPTNSQIMAMHVIRKDSRALFIDR